MKERTSQVLKYHDLEKLSSCSCGTLGAVYPSFIFFNTVLFSKVLLTSIINNIVKDCRKLVSVSYILPKTPSKSMVRPVSFCNAIFYVLYNLIVQIWCLIPPRAYNHNNLMSLRTCVIPYGFCIQIQTFFICKY